MDRRMWCRLSVRTSSTAGGRAPRVRLDLPQASASFDVRWFNRREGTWVDGTPIESGPVALEAPRPAEYLSAEAWVLLLRRR
jgi:hypothetical protein